MKNESIKKINSLGKAGKILSAISLAVCLIGVVCCIIGAISCATIPDNMMQADITGGGSIVVNADENGSKMIFRIGEKKAVNVEMHEKNERAFENCDLDDRLGNLNVKTKLVLNEEKSTPETEYYDLDMKINGNGGMPLAVIIAGMLAAFALVCVCMAVAVAFAKKLCKALETCNSPFEENVIKRMKSFVFSLIPLGVVSIAVFGVSAIGMAFIIVVVFLVFAIFKYGAQLQQESDETL